MVAHEYVALARAAVGHSVIKYRTWQGQRTLDEQYLEVLFRTG